MRIDFEQTGNIAGKAEEVANFMAQDSNIETDKLLTSYLFDIRMADGADGNLKVEVGNHSIFAIEYSSGRAPQRVFSIQIATIFFGASFRSSFKTGLL